MLNYFKSFKALDTWIFFPVSAIARLLPKSKRTDDVDPKWAHRLNKVNDDENWGICLVTDTLINREF